MCTNENHVSRYLRRPPRSYEEGMRERAERDHGVNRADTPNGTDDEGAASGVPKRTPRREGEARR
jgi:hypothetical protein